MGEYAPDCISAYGCLYYRDGVVKHLQPRDTERWYSVAELSEASGFNKASIYRAMKEGRLAFKCPSGTTYGRRVSLSEWNRFLDTL